MTQERPPSLWRQLWARPEAGFADVGFTSEYVVAGLRLLVAVVVVGFLVHVYVQAPHEASRQVLLGVAAGALLEALLVYSAVRRNWGRSWIGFVASALDVSLVSGALLVLLAMGQAEQAAHSMVLFPAYFLVLGATSLRYDARICLVSGALATIQHAVIVAAAERTWLRSVGATPAEVAWHGTEQAVRLLLLAAATVMAATIVVHARRLRVLSISDGLTGLANRGYFDERLREEGAVAARAGKPVAVIMIDIDHFKRFNDTHGHRAGDEALRAMARLIRKRFRATDVVARYGGEELALILPGMGPELALRRLEEVRRAVESLAVPIPHRGGALSVTVSIGLATWPADGGTIDHVLQRADERLYEAKGRGRNRVCGPVPALPRGRAELAPGQPAAGA